MKFRLLVLLLLFTLSCSTEKKTNQIFIEVSPEKLRVDKKDIRKDEFEKELKSIIDRKTKNGFQRDDLIVNLRVDPRTRRGDIADIETTMRR